MAISVRLSPREEHEALLLARDTTKICRMQNTNPRGEDGRDENEIRGARAEFAVAKLFGLDPPKFNVLGDEGKDLWFGDTSIDVKFTKTEELIFDSLDSFRADVAILVTQKGSDLVVQGGIRRENFASVCKEKEKLYGTKLCVDLTSLAKPEAIWRSLREKQIKEGL